MVGYRVSRMPEPDPEGRGSDDERSIDERSVAADSWSVKSEYGSTLDGDDTRNADVADAMAGVNRMAIRESNESEEEDGEDKDSSVLGLRSHWDATYAEEFNNFLEIGDPGEVWFGTSVLEASSVWVARIAEAVATGNSLEALEASGTSATVKAASEWRVVDLGTGNGLFLHALARLGFKDLTGTDYSDGAVELAKAVAGKAELPHILFMVDDILDSKLGEPYDLVLDKGTLDAIKLHPEGRVHKKIYRQTVERITRPGGLLIVTSCNSTKDELIADLAGPIHPSTDVNGSSASSVAQFEYLEHIRTYPTFRFGGVEGSRVCTVAFRKHQ